jgi:hypothetical protein
VEEVAALLRDLILEQILYLRVVRELVETEVIGRVLLVLPLLLEQTDEVEEEEVEEIGLLLRVLPEVRV